MAAAVRLVVESRRKHLSSSSVGDGDGRGGDVAAGARCLGLVMFGGFGDDGGSSWLVVLFAVFLGVVTPSLCEV